MNLARRSQIALAALFPLVGWASVAPADIFFLKNQGEVRGELTNPDESPRKSYVIKTAGGGQVVLTADQVERVQPQSPAEIKYDRFRADIPDTVEGQWKAAEWCLANRLTKHRELHLARILELDPNHEAARHALGYSQVAGQWVTQQQAMLDAGYVKSKFAPGKWVSPQEEELLASRDKTTKAQLAWKAELKRFDRWLSGDKAPQAIAGIKAIDDPLAVPALSAFLASEKRRDVRLLYVAALARINTPPSMDALVQASLFDGDEDIRAAALDEVVAHKYDGAVHQYVQALKHKDNAVINYAAAGLGRLGDEGAIGPLIESLVTTHSYKIQDSPPGQTAATFGTGGNAGQFNFGGGGPKIVKETLENRAVLQALVDLTGGESFNYDVRAWKNWYVARRKPSTLDARRDVSP
jgi:hypothetical protein